MNKNIGVSKILIQRFILSRNVFYIVLGIVVGFCLAVASFWLVRELSLAESFIKVDMESRVQQYDFEKFNVKNRPFLGDSEAVVTVVELTDYECPFCERHNETVLPKLISEYGDRIRYVAVNFPLTNIHPSAFTVSVAAECAHQQGKFWEYRRELFASENGLMLDSLKFIAERIGLNINQFEICIKSIDIQSMVEQDIFVAESLGATGTPTFFINDKVLVGARSFELFKIVIDEELEKYEN